MRQYPHAKIEIAGSFLSFGRDSREKYSYNLEGNIEMFLEFREKEKI